MSESEHAAIQTICKKRMAALSQPGSKRRTGSQARDSTPLSSLDLKGKESLQKAARQDGARGLRHMHKDNWKIHSVCNKGIKKQYRHLKHISNINPQTCPIPGVDICDLKCDQKLNVLTVNGRGLKAKVALMRKVLEQKPDVIVWTEHHLPAGATIPRWVSIMLQGYTWRHSSLPAIKVKQAFCWPSTWTCWREPQFMRLRLHQNTRDTSVRWS